MAMAMETAVAVNSIRRFAEFAFFWQKPQRDCWRA
jgi:hypothetical protein